MSEIRRPDNGRPGAPVRDLAANPPEMAPPRPPARGDGDTVFVACNLPNGLQLQVFATHMVHEQGFGGGRDVSRSFLPEGAGTVVVRGNAFDIQKVLEGADPPRRFNGYAITDNVPREHWDAWLAQNRDQAYIRKHCIFAEPTIERIIARCREMKGPEGLSGFEPINPDNPAQKNPELRGLRFEVQRGTRDDT